MDPSIFPREVHSVSRKNIDPDALRVLYRLHHAGYRAYLVGGGVRDLLLGLRPKDFDVATDAHPHDVKKVFRNCRIIGRRFRLAHVFFGGKIIEVSTFRRKTEVEADEGARPHENTFGTPAEDAWRRDFTINALFYNIADFSLIDYVGGFEDLRRRRIVAIGDPRERFAEDPVRMIRALRMAAKLELAIVPDVLEAIGACRTELAKSAPARLFEELNKTMLCGASSRALHSYLQHGLLGLLLPELERHLLELDSDVQAAGAYWTQLAALDDYPRRDRITAPVWLGALLAGPIEREVAGRGRIEPDQLHLLLERLTTGLPMPRRVRDRLHQMLLAQGRLRRSPLPGRVNLVARPYFDEALTLFELRAAVSGAGLAELEQWQELRERHPPGPPAPAKRRRRRRRRPG